MPEKNSKTLIQQYATRLGDDSLILGHRLSEWCGNAPFLEEEIALTNVALDYIGRARFFYGYAAELSNGTQTEDSIAYLRDCRQYQNFLINELPRGNFAYTIARQLIIDIFYSHFLPRLIQSKDETLSAIAEKAIKETQYHLKRSTDWTICLGDGSEESHIKIQTAFEELWGYTDEMFSLDHLEEQLVSQGVAVDTKKIKNTWKDQIEDILTKATLTIPRGEWGVSGGREGYHTEHLGHLLSDLQYMQRTYPGLKW